MNTPRRDEEEVFHVAREFPGSDPRAKYLDQVCAGDQALRERVEALLESHDEEQSFLKSNDAGRPTEDLPPVTEVPGQEIGRYKLLQKIGEGGFGVVYMAEQQRPVRRKVALKIIKPGMDTHAVIARFEAERQALALMDHSNIARVLDGGATDSGRPYFVMELVKGVPLTEYCDKNELSTQERLKLFMTVCQAVQHAHQKGIIHRDLKPSNVLVTLADGKPIVKVIDFGVAKATNQQLTEKTLFTAYGQMVGTPQYMSPEQAEMSCLDVDTRSDVYSLGVLLYELLTGTTRLEIEVLRSAGYAEIQRLIRDEEPPKPSTRLSTSREKLTVIAKHRSVSPEKLKSLVQGDLDWIVMKALEKERTRRYESASRFAEDVERYLANEAVEARPPTTAYRVRKFAIRHRPALITATIVSFAVIAALVSSTWMAFLRIRTLAELRDVAYQQAVVTALLPHEGDANDASRVALRAGVDPMDLKVLEGIITLNNGEYEKAARIAREIVAVDEQHIGSRALLAHARLWGGFVDEWMLESNWLASNGHPKTDTDRLLMAYALVLHDSDHAMRLLRDTQSMERTPVGLLLQGQDLMMRADEQQSVALFDDAVRHFEFVHEKILRGNPGAVAWRANTIAHAIEFCRSRGEIVEPYMEAGRQLLKQLPVEEGAPFLAWSRWKLCRALGDDQGASTAIQIAGRYGYFCWFVAADCLTNNSSSDAIVRVFDQAISDRGMDKYVRLARAYVVPNLRNEPRELETLEELAHDRSGMNRMFALCALWLAGDPEYVSRLATNGLTSEQDDWGNDRFATEACLNYLANPSEMTERQLLDTMSRIGGYATVNAQFTIAMMHLAAKDRDSELKHFKDCAETIAVGNFSYEMANALVRRMNADRDWPVWLHNEKSQKVRQASFPRQ